MAQARPVPGRDALSSSLQCATLPVVAPVEASASRVHATGRRGHDIGDYSKRIRRRTIDPEGSRRPSALASACSGSASSDRRAAKLTARPT
jgi:hypothetical protein